MEEPILNSHNKLEYEPAHSCEHLLNATMVKMFGCPRSRNAHVEKSLSTVKLLTVKNAVQHICKAVTSMKKLLLQDREEIIYELI